MIINDIIALKLSTMVDTDDRIYKNYTRAQELAMITNLHPDALPTLINLVNGDPSIVNELNEHLYDLLRITCIHLGDSSIDCVKFLLENGAHINDKSPKLNALILVCKYSNLQHNYACVKLLVEHGFDIECGGNYIHILHSLIRKDTVDSLCAANYLIERGIKIDKMLTGSTSLMIMCKLVSVNSMTRTVLSSLVRFSDVTFTMNGQTAYDVYSNNQVLFRILNERDEAILAGKGAINYTKSAAK